MQQGEITIVVHGAAAATGAVDGQLLRRTVELLAKELPPGRVAAIAAQLTGASRATAYALAARITLPASDTTSLPEGEEMS